MRTAISRFPSRISYLNMERALTRNAGYWKMPGRNLQYRKENFIFIY